MALTDKLTAIGDAIREKTGKEDLIPLTDMPSEIRGIPQGGGVGLDLFPYVRYVDFNEDLSEVTEDIVLHLERTDNAASMFSRVKFFNCKKLTIYLGDNCNSFSNFLSGFGAKNDKLTTVKIIEDTSKVISFSSAFYWRLALETIDCEFDMSSTSSADRMFAYSDKLKDVRFKAKTIPISLSFAQSPLLSAESVQSIIDGLADLTGGTAQVLTLHADVKAKLTDEQIATITNKNWTLA